MLLIQLMVMVARTDYGLCTDYGRSISIADFFPPNIDESISIADFFPPNIDESISTADYYLLFCRFPISSVPGPGHRVLLISPRQLLHYRLSPKPPPVTSPDLFHLSSFIFVCMDCGYGVIRLDESSTAVLAAAAATSTSTKVHDVRPSTQEPKTGTIQSITSANHHI
jgi:hypothetical protein